MEDVSETRSAAPIQFKIILRVHSPHIAWAVAAFRRIDLLRLFGRVT